MLSRLIQSEGRWIHALLVLSTITVALVLIGLLSNIVVYFSDILLILVMAWLFAFILSPLASLDRAPHAGVATGGRGGGRSTASCSWPWPRSSSRSRSASGSSFQNLIVVGLPTIQADLPETLRRVAAAA